MSRHQKWRTLSTKIVKKNPWWEYRLDAFAMPNGTRGEYHYMHTPGCSLIVALDAQGRIAWSRAYRYLFARTTLEIPGGGRKRGRSALQTAKDELREETGLTARRWKKIGTLWTNQGLTDETTTVFLASSLEQGAATPDATEDVALVWLTVKEVDQAIARGKVQDSQSIAAWTLAHPHILALIDQQKKKR